MFIRYAIGDESAPYFEDISRFVDEAKSKKRKIYFSTLTYAEIRQEHLRTDAHGSVRDFFSDMGASFIPIEPNPNILIAAGELRSAKSTNPGDPNPPAQRSIATPDAILLSSCIFAKKVLGIKDIIFHTTDEGKGKNWYGRSIPIIGFERWYPEATRTDRVKEVVALKREKPIHPEPMLKGIVVRGKFDGSRGV
jgi:hypothetical protein